MEPLGNTENFPIAWWFFLLNSLLLEHNPFNQIFSINRLQLHLLFFELIQCAVNCKTLSYNRLIWENWRVILPAVGAPWKPDVTFKE